MKQFRRAFHHICLTIAMSCAALLFLPAGTERAAAQMATSTCLAVAQDNHGPRLWKAAFGSEPVQAQAADRSTVTISYAGHSAFRVTSPEGVAIVTDYSGNHGNGDVPDVVTMNHAHGTHFTNNPDPRITHVLRGWNETGDGPARHHLEVKDALIRNVATDLYYDGVLYERDGNSIFIFEIAGLCIGHLGHLHHKLAPEHIAEIGRIDVLFMPVDGTYTMSQGGMIELAGQLRSSMIIPMHYFSSFSLQRFLAGMEPDFAIEVTGENEIAVSLNTLPARPTVTVLSPWSYLR